MVEETPNGDAKMKKHDIIKSEWGHYPINRNGTTDGHR
jgi:hypothetical protein